MTKRSDITDGLSAQTWNGGIDLAHHREAFDGADFITICDDEMQPLIEYLQKRLVANRSESTFQREPKPLCIGSIPNMNVWPNGFKWDANLLRNSELLPRTFTYGIDVAKEPEPQPERWEAVTHAADGAGHTYKLKVPGGWLYRTVSYRWKEQSFHITPSGMVMEKAHFVDNDIVAQSTCFVPEEK